MCPPPADDDPASTGQPDRQTLRLLERILRDEPVVAATEYDPDDILLGANAEVSRPRLGY